MKPDREIELCLASAHFFPTHGGAQLRFLRYLQGLRERGIHTRVLSGTPKLKKREKLRVAGESSSPENGKDLTGKLLDGIEVRRVQLPNRAGRLRSIVFNQAILDFCRQPGYRPDVLQVVSSLQPRSIPWLMWLHRLGIPVLYAYTIPVTLPSNPIRRIVRKWFWRRLYNAVDGIIANNLQLRDMMLDLGVTKRIDVIPNGVNLVQFRPPVNDDERKRLRASLGMSPHRKVVITVGAIHPRKGSDMVLEAWTRLVKTCPDTELFLVGLRKDLSYPKLAGFRKKLEDLIADSGASDRVHFTGLVRNIEEYLRASDLFVFPSLREGMPNVVLEAMASGVCAVLTPFVGLTDDFGKPGQEYLLTERDPEALSAAMATVLTDNELRTYLAQHGRQWVETTMDVEKSLDRYATLYREMAERGRSAN
jgi:glycosyltransferase involved in cell wall biosynthesis